MVSFGHVEVIEQAVTMGRDPCSSEDSGVSLESTSWEVKETTILFSVDEFEQVHPPRRSRKELRLSQRQREGMQWWWRHCGLDRAKMQHPSFSSSSSSSYSATTTCPSPKLLRVELPAISSSPKPTMSTSSPHPADKALCKPVRRASKVLIQCDPPPLAASPPQCLMLQARSA
jgi:hypothetical protein